MSIPHGFPSLVDGTNQVVLITGTGLSTPNCPMLKELKLYVEKVANDLEVEPCSEVFELAESILNKLVSNGKSDSESRLWLAEQLGMLDDRCWFGEIGLPLSGNTPRHRAIARFVVEERIGAIINLNWDALLEASLDSVGLTETETLQRPWKITKYARVVDKKHMPLLAHANIFPVIKPHGCVRDLQKLRNDFKAGVPLGLVTFKFTATEMTKLNADQETAVNTKVNESIAKYPLIGIGWRASEDYLTNTIIEIAKQVQRSELDSFTLIDIEWNQKHLDIANAYNKSEAESFAQVSKAANPTTDSLMQWLQARHALKRMIAMTPDELTPLKQLLQELDQSNYDHPIQQWADFWLPTWVRVCWRAGAMKSYHPITGKLIGPHEIPIFPRDAHIPLTGMSMERRDIHAASKLLCALSGLFKQFRFDLYPGGLFDVNNNCLYLPLPGWKENVPFSDLTALKPLVEALKNNLGFVKKIILVWLNNQDDPPDMSIRRQLQAQFLRLMPLAAYAAEDSVSWIGIDELKGK